MNSTKHLYLIDGSGYIFRAYYAIRSLATSKGFPTNAIYGFTQMILKLAKEVQPTYWAIVFDSIEPTFRDELYEKYKANRSEPPDDLVPQFPFIPKVVEAMNVPMFVKPGFEADDIIATMAKRAKAEGFTVTIISGDKDLMQLVNDKVDMWDPMKEKHYTHKEVLQRFGVAPSSVADVFGLVGDTSDNIPGVPGIGPKTASKLIQEYGDLETVLKNADKIPGKTGESLKTYADQARLSKQLATLHYDVPVPFDENALRYQPINTEACNELFRELEFSRLVSEVAPKVTLSKSGYRLILDEKELEALLEKIKKEKLMLAVDLETTSLDVMKAKIVGVSLSWAKGEAAYIPVGHTGLDVPKQISLETLLRLLKPILVDASIPKIGQNLKYDLAILKQLGLEVKNIFCDTMIASYLLNPQGPHNLDALAQQHLNHRTIRYEDVTGKGKEQKSFAEVPLDVARDCSCEDADCTWQLAQIFLPRLANSGLMDLFKNLEMPLMEILLKMELNGIKVDTKLLKDLSANFEKELKSLEKEIYTVAQGPFNIQSPKQLGEILFDKLKLPGGKKTKTGFSTSVDVLEELAAHHALPELILKFRSLSKLKSTYTDALQALVNPKTGRIHTSFNQTVAATGRLSSSDPNLQNIPIRTKEGREIRKAFVAEEGFLFLSADYSQIELRILAHYTEDKNLLQAFAEGKDVHSLTAAALFGGSPDKVTPEQRSAGKTVNFAVIYGQTPYGLASQLKIDPKEAKEYIDNYFKQYESVKTFKEKALEKAREEGFVQTLFGRRRFVPDVLSHNMNIRANAERMAFNTIFQGSAADIIKKAMIDIDAQLGKISPRARMLLQVHDELVFEVPKEDIEKVEALVKEKMETVFPLKVPLIVDCGMGKNWEEAG
ncbi:MAG: DNA polymerase I [Deltaproteobacteria bacterium RIFCSPLOWO2_02_FULL_46_8]|nr:MAG: DNA polymerase I [Deltaproteobacteria bacterium RIFCSPLOWO2_02_FULL_46_8]